MSLKRGRWCYEVRILETDPSTPSESGCVGWADSKLFFGDSSKGIGVGDGPTSWGLIVQDMRASGGCPGRKRSGKVTEEWARVPYYYHIWTYKPRFYSLLLAR